MATCCRRGDFRQLSVKFFDEKLKGECRGLGGWGKLHLATPDDRCTPCPRSRRTGRSPWAGSSHLTADVTTVVPDSRAFSGLAVGTSPLDARLVQNNVMPLNEEQPASGERRRIELPAVAVDVRRGRSLFLVASAVSDTFAGMGSRVPGVVVLENTKAHLPTVG